MEYRAVYKQREDGDWDLVAVFSSLLNEKHTDTFIENLGLTKEIFDGSCNFPEVLTDE